MPTVPWREPPGAPSDRRSLLEGIVCSDNKQLLDDFDSRSGDEALSASRIVRHARELLAADEVSYWCVESEGRELAARRTAVSESEANGASAPLQLSAEQCAGYFAATQATGLLISQDALHDDRIVGTRESYLGPPRHPGGAQHRRFGRHAAGCHHQLRTAGPASPLERQRRCSDAATLCRPDRSIRASSREAGQAWSLLSPSLSPVLKTHSTRTYAFCKPNIHCSRPVVSRK